MITTKNNPAEETAAREIVATRVLDAPRELVFEAWENPKHLARWWGPKGFTNTFEEFDLRQGGHWRFVMHSPDGVDYQNKSIFDEVIKPERIVFWHLDPIHKFQMMVTFAEESGKTRLTWYMRHETVAKCEEVKPFVEVANEQNFDRLEAELARMSRRSSLPS